MLAFYGILQGDIHDEHGHLKGDVFYAVIQWAFLILPLKDHG